MLVIRGVSSCLCWKLLYSELTKYNSWYNCKTDSMNQNMKSPIRHILAKLLRRKLQTADKKDKCDGAIKNAVL